MKKNCKRIFGFLLSLIFAVSLLAAPAEPIQAKDDEEEYKSGVHSDPSTFEKNFSLSVDQKKYTITEIEKVVNQITNDNMSDLEKYYTIAMWSNKRVVYDTDFWCGGYNFDYYSHQWDSYGAMKEDEKSVCAGIAIFYADMCHAADLPCRYVRTDPEYLDHTINYIPNINGHAYYADITENIFLMSEYSSNSFEPNIDKEFAYITDEGRCRDKSFDFYQDEEGDSLTSTYIKDYYDVPFIDWFNEFALHKNTTKKFGAEYEEKGSGESGTHYASYKTTPSQKNELPDVWFLEDFYKDPAAIKTKILNKEFDEQLLNVSGVKKNYDCATKEELEEAVNRDISVEFFPSAENGEVVAKAANLTKAEDYTVTCDEFDAENHKAKITINSAGDYSGKQEIEVKLNSATVIKEPAKKNALVYNGTKQELIEPGEAEYGEIQYALGTKTEPTQDFSPAVPAAVNAGKYYIWYKVVGDENHVDSEMTCMEKVASIARQEVSFYIEDMKIRIGEQAVASPIVDTDIPIRFIYTSSDEDIVSVDENGVITAKKEGVVTIFVDCDLKYASLNYEAPYSTEFDVEVVAGDPINIADSKVVLSKSNFTYNGKVQKPKVKKIKGLKLKEGTDYITYIPKFFGRSSKNVGSYTLIIIGKGKYTGVTEATYKINPKGTVLKELKAAKKSLVVKWKKQPKKMSVSRITGYQIKLATNSKFTKNKKTVDVKGYKKNTKKVENLKGGTKYYAKIRTYKIVKGKKCYSTWSKAKMIKTEKGE